MEMYADLRTSKRVRVHPKSDDIYVLCSEGCIRVYNTDDTLVEKIEAPTSEPKDQSIVSFDLTSFGQLVLLDTLGLVHVRCENETQTKAHKIENGEKIIDVAAFYRPANSCFVLFALFHNELRLIDLNEGNEIHRVKFSSSGERKISFFPGEGSETKAAILDSSGGTISLAKVSESAVSLAQFPLEGGLKISNATDFCIDSKHNLIVADKNNDRCQVFGQTGKLLWTFEDDGEEPLKKPYLVCCDTDDNIMIVSLPKKNGANYSFVTWDEEDEEEESDDEYCCVEKKENEEKDLEANDRSWCEEAADAYNEEIETDGTITFNTKAADSVHHEEAKKECNVLHTSKEPRTIQKDGNLIIQIEKVCELKGYSQGLSVDKPYIRFRIFGSSFNGDSYEDRRCSAWGEDTLIRCPILSNGNENIAERNDEDFLRIEAWNSRALGDEFIGGALVPLYSLQKGNYSKKQWLSLRSSDGIECGKVSISVNFSVSKVMNYHCKESMKPQKKATLQHSLQQKTERQKAKAENDTKEEKDAASLITGLVNAIINHEGYRRLEALVRLSSASNTLQKNIGEQLGGPGIRALLRYLRSEKRKTRMAALQLLGILGRSKEVQNLILREGDSPCIQINNLIFFHIPESMREDYETSSSDPSEHDFVEQFKAKALSIFVSGDDKKLENMNKDYAWSNLAFFPQPELAKSSSTIPDPSYLAVGFSSAPGIHVSGVTKKKYIRSYTEFRRLTMLHKQFEIISKRDSRYRKAIPIRVLVNDPLIQGLLYGCKHLEIKTENISLNWEQLRSIHLFHCFQKENESVNRELNSEIQIGEKSVFVRDFLFRVTIDVQSINRKAIVKAKELVSEKEFMCEIEQHSIEPINGEYDKYAMLMLPESDLNLIFDNLWINDEDLEKLIKYNEKNLGDTEISIEYNFPRSRKSEEEVLLMFHNISPFAVEIFWVDYEGAEQYYHTIQQGESYTHSSFSTHVWSGYPSLCLNEADQKGRLVFNGMRYYCAISGREEQNIYISAINEALSHEQKMIEYYAQNNPQHLFDFHRLCMPTKQAKVLEHNEFSIIGKLCIKSAVVTNIDSNQESLGSLYMRFYVIPYCLSSNQQSPMVKGKKSETNAGSWNWMGTNNLAELDLRDMGSKKTILQIDILEMHKAGHNGKVLARGFVPVDYLNKEKQCNEKHFAVTVRLQQSDPKASESNIEIELIHIPSMKYKENKNIQPEPISCEKKFILIPVGANEYKCKKRTAVKNTTGKSELQGHPLSVIAMAMSEAVNYWNSGNRDTCLSCLQKAVDEAVALPKFMSKIECFNLRKALKKAKILDMKGKKDKGCVLLWRACEKYLASSHVDNQGCKDIKSDSKFTIKQDLATTQRESLELRVLNQKLVSQKRTYEENDHERKRKQHEDKIKYEEYRRKELLMKKNHQRAKLADQRRAKAMQDEKKKKKLQEDEAQKYAKWYREERRLEDLREKLRVEKKKKELKRIAEARRRNDQKIEKHRKELELRKMKEEKLQQKRQGKFQKMNIIKEKQNNSKFCSKQLKEFSVETASIEVPEYIEINSNLLSKAHNAYKGSSNQNVSEGISKSNGTKQETLFGKVAWEDVLDYPQLPRKEPSDDSVKMRQKIRNARKNKNKLQI